MGTARIRTIKPQFWGSHDTSRLSIHARLLFIGLISMADDEGRFLASPNSVNGFVFPNDDLPPARIRKLLDECADVGVIRLYQIQGINYGLIPTFRAHQRVSHPQPSALPPPADGASP